MLGICNGFQVLCEAGLLPGALTRNSHLHFRNRDQVLVVERADTAWTTDYAHGQRIVIPVKNGEGRYVAADADLDRLEGEGRVVFRYADGNPNGSSRDIAGVTSEDGRVVGLMPHPEHAVEDLTGPSTDGLGFFTSVLKAVVNACIDTVELAAKTPGRGAALRPSSGSRTTSTPASATSSGAVPPPPSSRCTPSCGASTAPTSRRRCTCGQFGDLPPSDALLVGIGENAGVVDVGDGYAVTFKVESHNHPSYVEPYQGAATGVGGIVRDILTMGARPIAVMD